MRCAECGSGTTLPDPSEEELDAAYGTWYRPAAGRFLWPAEQALRRTRALLAKRIDRKAPVGPILDVGCGEGVLLDALHRVGRRALGLEREANRDDVRAADIADVGGGWAGIVFFHSLEHLPAPGDALARAADALMPGGLLVVAVPNFESWQARLFGTRWFARELPLHLVHLPARALIERVEALGLTVERISYARGGFVLFGWLHGLVAALPGHLDLYASLRLPEARRQRLSGVQGSLTLAAAVLLLPLAAIGALIEILGRRGGTTYVEARRV